MKQLLKQSVRGVAILMVIPVLVLYFLVTGVLARQHVIAGFSQGMALLPGIFGVYLRAAFYRFTLTYCSPDAVIGFLTLLSKQVTDKASFVEWAGNFESIMQTLGFATQCGAHAVRHYGAFDALPTAADLNAE